MRPRLPARPLIALSALFLVWAPPVQGQHVADPDPIRFTDTFEDWATVDAENSTPHNPIVFVGSSSINFWRTAEYFPQFPVINRGFGGSQANDATHWVHEAVLKYDPSIVVYYEGDNDTSVGKKAPQVFEDMREFAEAVQHESPGTHVVFLSVKPGPARWDVWGEAVATNRLLEEFAAKHYNVHYVDVGSDMLDGDGQPIPELFVADGIHMTPAGYDIWARILTPVLAGLR
ncbi:MAG: GDSL-type esterase/lipase family protein [Gemmatimonadota bacterium]|nr:GDSL-type esterase/lipase family protein [Gemmatimonadota bacterium]